MTPEQLKERLPYADAFFRLKPKVFECWANVYPSFNSKRHYTSKAEAKSCCGGGGRAILLREVTE